MGKSESDVNTAGSVEPEEPVAADKCVKNTKLKNRVKKADKEI